MRNCEMESDAPMCFSI